jgi:hypothetical protein
MARRKTRKPRKRTRRRTLRRVGRPSRGLTKSVYHFKRSFTDVVNLSNPALIPGTQDPATHPGAFWEAVDDSQASPAGFTKGTSCRIQAILEDLPNWSEFAGGLFDQYKLNGIAIEVIPQFNIMIGSGDGLPTSTQGLAYIMPYNFSQQKQATTPIYENTCLQTQACKKRVIFRSGKSFKVYSKLFEVGLGSQAARSTTNIQYLQKSRWHPMDTDSTKVKHYGRQFRFQPINYGDWGTDINQVKLIYTVYLSCKGVV